MKSRSFNWKSPAVLILAGLAFYPFPAEASKKDRQAAKLYKAGEDAEAKDDFLTSYQDYYQAFQLDPQNLAYKTSYQRMKVEAAGLCVTRGEKLRDQGDNTGALTEFMRALEIDPTYELAQQDIKAIRDKEDHPAPKGESSLGDGEGDIGEMAAPIELKPVSNEPIDITATQDSKVIYQTVGKIAGINVLFDPDYNSKRIPVDLKNVSLYDALHIIGLDSKTFWRPVTPNTIFVAADTRAKRTELEEQAVETFYLSNAAQQNDLNDVQTAIRNLITGAKLYAVPSQNAIVMRATPDELMLAKQVINDLDKARPEVIVDVAVLEVSRNTEHNLGMSLPQSFGLTLQANTSTTAATTTTSTTSTTSTASTSGITLNQLGSLSASNFGVTLGQATANLLYTDTSTKVLQNPRIRATDGQKADVKVGERIPIATGSYQTGAATAVVSSLVNTQFQYIDVGVEVEITPTIHFDHDVSLKLKIVVSQTNGNESISGVTEPIITQRTAEQTIRLRDGEPSILNGILTQTSTKNITGTPGIGELPLLKYLFSSNDWVTSKDEIVFILTPHVIRGTQLSPENLQQIDTGTGTNVEVRRIATIPVKIPAGALEGKSIPATSPVVSGAQVDQSAAQAAAAPPVVNTSTPPGTAALQQDAVTNAAAFPGSPIKLQVTSPATPPKVGATFQVAVNLTGGTDVYSVPMQVMYDPTKLTFINADTGTLLSRDGQAVAMAHRDDGGNVVLSISRPPGVAGITGDGSVCVLTFQAKAAGDSIVNVTKAVARNSKQEALPVMTSGAIMHVMP
jgi:general secretion pathway protein D